MKTFAITLIFTLSAFAYAQACDRNKIDSNTRLSNQNGNYYNVVKNSGSKTPTTVTTQAKGRR